MERGGGGVVEDQIDFQVEEVGGVEKDRLLHLFDIGMEQVHGLVHMPEFEILAGWQVDGGQPAIPDPEFGFRHAEPVGDHGQQGSLQLCPTTCRLFNGFETLFQTQPFPKGVYDQRDSPRRESA